MDGAYLAEWANLLLRWLHVIAGIAWIGASFYFVGLDNTLEPAKDRNPRVRGEQWAVHGGGFYHKQKYLVAPAQLPERLHWFKWEAYWTWLSGFALFVLIYWGNAGTYLVDPARYDMAPWAAVLLSAAMLYFAWAVYDVLCHWEPAQDGRVMALCGGLLLAGATIAATSLFAGRGAFLQVGAMIGTIMVANVYFTIIPAQKRMVAAMLAGQEPDPRDGIAGRMRSVHNNYLTLPVLFLMLSPHYPMTWQAPHNWAVLLAVALAGAVVRHFFNLRHGGRTVLALPAAGAAIVAVLAFLLAPPRVNHADVALPSMPEVQAIVSARCVTCHAARPSNEAFQAPPKGVVMETAEQIRRWAPVARQQLATAAMPPGNTTAMTDDERVRLVAWIAAGAPLR